MKHYSPEDLADHVNAVTALRDIADHLDRNPHLAVPMGVTPANGSVQMQVRAIEFQAWRNTATDIHVESIVDTGHGHHAHSAIVVGRTALELVCVDLDGMDRQSFALLVGFGYQTPSGGCLTHEPDVCDACAAREAAKAV